MREVFIRNDDVRGKLSDSLKYITESVLREGFCISHAVEPRNVTKDVVDWLLHYMDQYPEQMEVIQHGLDHNEKTEKPVGEFGGNRNFDDQLKELSEGRDLMNKWFDDKWFPAFSFPFGTYNRATLLALESLSYPVITTGVRLTMKRRLLNLIGHIIQRKHFGRYNITYYGEAPPGYSLIEFPVMLNTTKQYSQPDGGIQKNSEELMNDWNGLKNFKTLGILTHHRFNTQDDTDNLIRFLKNIGETEDTHFSTIREIFKK